MPSSAVSPIPQGLVFQGMFPMCIVCALLLSLGIFFLQSSYLQRIFLPLAVLSRSGIDFNKVCSSLLVKWDLLLLLPEVRPCKMYVSADLVLAGFVPVFWGWNLQRQD